MNSSGRARLSYQQAAALFSKASAGATLHQLRHSALTHDAEKGTGTPMLMRRSGHTSVRSLARYGQVSQPRHWPATRPSMTKLARGLPLVPWTHRLKGKDRAMAETRRKFDRDFKEGAVRLVRETGKPIAQVARDLGIHDGTLANWVNADRRRRGEADGALGEGTAMSVLAGAGQEALAWRPACQNADHQHEPHRRRAAVPGAEQRRPRHDHHGDGQPCGGCRTVPQDVGGPGAESAPKSATRRRCLPSHGFSRSP